MGMNSKIVMFSIIVLVSIFSVALPMDSVFAQTSDVTPHGGGEDGEGKSCPTKEKKPSPSIGLDF